MLDTVEGEKKNSEFPPVDSIFTIIEDLTADGEADSLELRVVGPRMEDPFSWTVRIWVRDELVFEHEAVDSYWDQFFGEPGYAGTSGNREQDKRPTISTIFRATSFIELSAGPGLQSSTGTHPQGYTRLSLKNCSKEVWLRTTPSRGSSNR